MAQNAKMVKKIGKEIHSAAKDLQQDTKKAEKMVKDSVKDEVKVVVKFVKKRRNIKDYFTISRAGIITGAADNDPAGIITYTQVGAFAGTSLLWLPIVTFPMLAVLEEISARIGIVTKKGLNQVIAENFGQKVAIVVALILIFGDTITIGANIAGMGQVAGVLTNTNWLWWLIPIIGLLSYLLISKNYRTVSRFLLLLTPILLLYVGAAFLVRPDWFQVLKDTFVPRLVFDKKMILIVVAAIGTTIAPYMLFWQTTEEVEDKKSVTDLKKETRGVIAGMVYPQVIFYFIVLASAYAFFGKNQMLETPEQAALALKPVVGEGAFLLFSLGLFGAGLLAIPVIAATTAYVSADAFKWKGGLSRLPKEAIGFYIVLIGSLLAGALIAIFHANPIKLLIYSQVIKGFLVPPLLILILLVSNNPKVMGKYTNSFWTNLIGWATVVIMAGLDLFLIWGEIAEIIS